MALSGPAQGRPTAGRMRPEASSRRVLPYVVAGILLLAIAAYVLLVVRPGRTPTLAGGVIDPPFAAPDFKLNDQSGQPVALSSFIGKVVVLTFLYTNCPDACPLITEKLHQAHQQLGPDTSRLAILVVTVDPARDTEAQVRSYSAQKDMLDKWHFLVGAQEQLQPVWRQYGIAAFAEDATALPNPATPTPLAGSGTISHASPVYVIDPAGKARAILDVDFTPGDLVQDVRALLQ